MTQQWSDVDEFLSRHVASSDPLLQQVLEACTEAGLPEIQVFPNQGKFLHLLAVIQGARTILELGTLGGYSTICLARALPQAGRLISLEAEPHHATVACRNLEAAGVSEKVDVRVGPALETLPRLEVEGLAPFDLIFIDADKVNTPEYFDWAIRLSRPGSVIVVDNVVRKGEIINAESDDASVQGMRRFLEQLASETRVDASALQMVGSKGYDGFVMARVR